MSEKKSKQERKLSLVTEETDYQAVAEEMAKTISKMYEERDKKALNAKFHLCNQLDVTADKYLTANGVMSAMIVVRDVFGTGNLTVDEELDIAKAVAKHMSAATLSMSAKAEKLDPEEMNTLCGKFYEEDFASSSATPLDLIYELMSLQLCQNVGPNADDVADFCRTADEEIEKATNDLKAYCEEHELSFEKLCGPHDKCPDCLCMDCANDCKEGKEIVEGQSAYDVCEKFVEKE